MWEPEPGWLALPGGAGPSTVGIWRAAHGDRAVVVKRLAAPRAGDPPELSDPAHFAYWRREADVFATGIAERTAGLRSVVGGVEEDPDGITITREWVEDTANSGLFVARALGTFAGSDLPRTRFLASDQLRARLARTAINAGGWPTLGRTRVADVADHLWSCRTAMLARLDALAQVPQHGDPTTSNVPGRRGEVGVAIDWATLGIGAVGGDLGLLAVSAREGLEPLLDAYLLGLPRGLADRDDVELGATIVAVYTALGRAEWALARVAGGEGALAGKYRHPSVAPHLRALQRLFPQVERLVEG